MAGRRVSPGLLFVGGIFFGVLCIAFFSIYSTMGSVFALLIALGAGLGAMACLSGGWDAVKERRQKAAALSVAEEAAARTFEKSVPELENEIPSTPRPAAKTPEGEYYDPDTGEILELASKKARKAPVKANSEYMDRWEQGLSTVWRGSEDIEFTYENRRGEKSRRRVTLSSVMVDATGGVYLRGLCHLRNEERTFNLSNITTKILKGSKRYEVEDFLVDVLDIEDEKLGW